MALHTASRRTIILVAIVLAVGVDAVAAQATGLYKGSGRRTRDYSWSWRANGSVGFQGVEDPLDQFGVNSYPVGGYTNFGLEFNVLGNQSLEILGSYLWVNDRQALLAIGPGEAPRPGTYRYEVSAWTVGGTWRSYFPRGTSSGYLGFGGGWVVSSDLEYVEQIQGSEPYAVRASGAGPEVHAILGYDGIPGPNVRMGMELGFRYSWVDFDNGIFGAGNFNGFFLGFRLGLAKTP